MYIYEKTIVKFNFNQRSKPERKTTIGQQILLFQNYFVVIFTVWKKFSNELNIIAAYGYSKKEIKFIYYKNICAFCENYINQ